MAKDKLTDYDATASNNTDIGGIDINQGTMIPSNVDNAIREIMSHLKDFAAGTEAVSSIAVSGDLTVDTNTLHVDSTNNNVGVGVLSPAFTYGGGIEIQRTDSATLRLQRTGSTASALELTADDGLTRLDTRTSVPMLFMTAGTERMRIDSNGHLILKKNLVLESTSEGIDFSGSGSSAETLDDYEEGTWTPTSPNGTLDVVRSNYTKIGRLVNLNCTIRYSTPSTSSNGVQLGGLPFASTANVEFIGTIMLNGQDVTTTSTYSYIFGGSASDVITLYQNQDNAGVLAIPYNAFGTNESLYISITYTTE